MATLQLTHRDTIDISKSMTSWTNQITTVLRQLPKKRLLEVRETRGLMTPIHELTTLAMRDRLVEIKSTGTPIDLETFTIPVQLSVQECRVLLEVLPVEKALLREKIKDYLKGEMKC